MKIRISNFEHRISNHEVIRFYHPSTFFHPYPIFDIFILRGTLGEHEGLL